MIILQVGMNGKAKDLRHYRQIRLEKWLGHRPFAMLLTLTGRIINYKMRVLLLHDKNSFIVPIASLSYDSQRLGARQSTPGSSWVSKSQASLPIHLNTVPSISRAFSLFESLVESLTKVEEHDNIDFVSICCFVHPLDHWENLDVQTRWFNLQSLLPLVDLFESRCPPAAEHRELCCLPPLEWREFCCPPPLEYWELCCHFPHLKH